MSKNPELPSHNDSTQSAAGGNDSSYRVGYGHPPKHSQFRPGQSGNPSGRPKRVKNLQAELLEELGELTRIREGDTELEIPKGRAIAKTLVRRSGRRQPACHHPLGIVLRDGPSATLTNSRSKERPRIVKSSMTSSAVNSRRRAENSNATDTQRSSETDNDKEQSNEK